MKTANLKPNKLINEKSPYLLQHAYNPVDWHPWNEETFELAKKEDKPIFLSVGYSTCYWCHVMEREVFENKDIADLMNRSFVNIKVDREERPDVDRVYMIALQSMTGSGGWPMSMFLTPDLKPFYGATYIPPKAKYNRSGFEDVVAQINDVWNNKRNEVINSSIKITDYLKDNLNKKRSPDEKTELNENIFDTAFEQIKKAYDYEHGGFGAGNKFPRPVVYNFFLAYYYYTKNSEALDIVTFTLKKMYEGGMYDHLGGGFHRYSVDHLWRVPHFEKMLYDQAQIVNSYLDVYQITKDNYFLDIAEDTLNYVLTNLTNKDGGFYSAEDAESALDISKPDIKEEGVYYLWDKREIDELLTNEESRIFNFYYGIEAFGNTISDPHNVFRNKNVLYVANDVYDTAKKFSRAADEITQIINECRKKLRNERNKRPRPHLDDKILTSWNGLMVSAFARAYQLKEKEIYLEEATSSAEFIKQNLYDSKQNILLHRFRDGEAKYSGTLVDYAFLIYGLLDLYEASFNTDYLEFAIKLNKIAVEKFYDEDSGGFFDISENETDIIFKTKETYDGAEPAGNSIQILNMLKLGLITDDNSLTKKAEKSLQLFYNEISKLPFSSPQMFFSLYCFLKTPKEIIISGDINSKETKTMLNAIRNNYMPNKIILFAEENLKSISPFINNIVKEKKGTNVYVCENYQCKLPVNDPDKLKELLN
ncbi:thioredoxin domain-containing protein [Bacteroidota bacterium]